MNNMKKDIFIYVGFNVFFQIGSPASEDQLKSVVEYLQATFDEAIEPGEYPAAIFI